MTGKSLDGAQELNGVQAPNGAQVTSGAQQPNGAQIANGLQRPIEPPYPLTPLGEPISHTPSAQLLASDPLTWHLHYWLSIGVLGMLRGENPLLMAFRTDIEHYNKIKDVEFRIRLVEAWRTYRQVHLPYFRQQWERLTLESEEAKPYLRDIDRMLVNKGAKAREYLCRIENMMISILRDGQIESARWLFDIIARVYQRLEEEEKADEEARNRKPNGINGTNGVHNKEG